MLTKGEIICLATHRQLVHLEDSKQAAELVFAAAAGAVRHFLAQGQLCVAAVG